MKKYLLIAFAAVLAASCQPSFEETQVVGPYTVSMIEKNVWHIEDCNPSYPAGNSVAEDGSFRMNNCSDMYIIRGSKKALLIDLSNNIKWDDTAAESLRSIFNERAGRKQKLIAITHNHGDHTGMLHAFAQDESVSFLLPVNDFTKDTAFPDTRKSLISDGQVLELGGMTLDCVQVAGHTPGSMLFFLKGHNMAFTGDALGSGTGVWLFTAHSFSQYEKGVAHLAEYIENPANGIDESKLIFYSGHMWQRGTLEKLDIQYLRDMQTLIAQIKDGSAEWEPYSIGRMSLNANFKYGTATITWNSDYAERMRKLNAHNLLQIAKKE